MIAIQNIGELPNGKHRYSVQINNEFICEFEHFRSDGLALCLEAARDAVQQEREDLVDELLMKMVD
jgi:hypothetical protein